MKLYIIDPDMDEIVNLRDMLHNTEFSPAVFHHSLFIGADQEAPCAAIVSLELISPNGLNVCKQLKKYYPTIRLILSSSSDIVPYEEKIKEHVDLILHKPYSRGEVLACLRSL